MIIASFEVSELFPVVIPDPLELVVAVVTLFTVVVALELNVVGNRS